MSEEFISSPIGSIPCNWSCLPIKEIVDPSRKVTYGIVQPGTFTEGGVVLIRGQDYINGWVNKDKFFLVSPFLHQQYRRSRVQNGDVLMCIVGYTGEANIVPEWINDANITQTTARISCDVKRYSPTFLLHFLRSDAGKEQISKYTKGSAQPGLNLADVEVFFVPSPPLPQQRKIARILTTVDNLIEKTEALIAKYQAIKQGMMHDLFTRGVDEHGHLRPPYEEAPELYKESELGWIPKEWEVDSGCNLFRLFSGTPPSKPREDSSGDCIYLKVDDFNRPENQYGLHVSGMSFGAAENLTTYVYQPGMIVFPKRGAAIFINRVQRLMKQGTVDPNLMLLEAGEKLDPEWMRLKLLYLGLGNICDNSGIPQINNKHLYPLRLCFPERTEQHRIATSLGKHEASIRSQKDSLTKLRTIKSGLMQDLLTGKVRVKVDEPEESVHV